MNRWIAYAAVLVAVTVVGFAATRNDQTEYRDSTGVVRLRIGVIDDKPILGMYDSKGRQQVSVTSDDKGQCYVQLIGRDLDSVTISIDGAGPTVTVQQDRAATRMETSGTMMRGGPRILP